MCSLSRRADTATNSRYQAFRALLLFGMQLVSYDEGGNLVINAPTDGNEDVPAIDTSFSQSTAGGTTRLCALSACNLTSQELNTILSLASASTFDPKSEGVTNSDGTFTPGDR